jgi:hypothetical protein
MSYTYLQESGEESSVDTFSDIPPYVLLRLSLTAAKSSCNGNETASYPSSQSGTMSPPLTECRGEERSMSFAEDSHARTSVVQGGGQESKENTQDCGPRWPGSSARFDPDSCSWKTRQHSLFGGLEEFSGTWPQWGTMLDGEFWALTSVATPTEGIESGLLPTPNASDWKGGTTSLRKDSGKDRADQWRHFVKLKYGMTYPHPTHSELLMGFPQEWTGLEPLAMPRFLKWQQQHGGF